MVRLVNIQINDKFASADYYPENDKIGGHIVVEIETEKIVRLIKADNIGWGVSQAKRTLIDMARTHSADTERTVLWY